MKYLFVLTFVCLMLNASGQDIFMSGDTAFERQTGNWYFTNVIKVDSALSKDVIFQKARQWFSESFVSAEAVIDNEDKAAGIIYGKGNIKMAKDVDGRVKFTIEIRCKESKVKYVLSNFTHEGACMINVYGTCGTGSYYNLNLGPLTQPECPYGYGKTGRSKEKFWNNIRSQTKKSVFYLVESLNSSFTKKEIKSDDTW